MVVFSSVYGMSSDQMQSQYRKLNNQVQYLINQSQKNSFSELEDSLASLQGQIQDNQYQIKKINLQYAKTISTLKSEILILQNFLNQDIN